jgi:hypothetical protein
VNRFIGGAFPKKATDPLYLTLLADEPGSMYLEKQDDSLLQPNYLYLPLLAHGSGIGGVVSSER